ncbi:UNVERIFIED_CONTAM: hypothetical protein GTU68_023220 [Idotea baltica]|nr:hypothetical protein [Idotea baltica]
MVYLTRRERFSASHRLYNDNWSLEQNESVFGKCSNEFFHGHNFQLFVTVKGKPDADTGFFVNAHELSQIIKKQVVDRVDHKNINMQVDFMKDIIPSCENFVMQIWKQINPHLPEGCILHSIKLIETENIYVEYFGE